MKMRTILFGSTGMIGQGVLLESLNDANIESILVINRQPCNIAHPKLKEIIHKDLFNLSGLTTEMTGYNACFFCLGISSAGLNENEYHRITYDLTLNVARTLVKLNKGMVFCYISGAGTDSSEKGRIRWARIKGKTENALLSLPFRKAYMFRPGFIQPMKGIRSKTRLYNALYAVFSPLS
jgi:nucleoside-diphosphate-sugar epimerase